MSSGPVEVIALLRKRPDISREEFIAYYESNHAPLIRSIAPEIIRYERAFLRDDGAILAPGQRKPDFDVVTLITFSDERSYMTAMERFADPRTAQVIADDEDHLFDRSATRFVRVDRHLSEQNGQTDSVDTVADSK